VRLAVFTPLAPIRSGIADYAEDLIGALGPRHDADVFVASAEERFGTAASERARVLGAHDFPWRHARAPYDLIVYQMGNAWYHDYMWPYLFRYPGLVVLHDGHLHHARAWSLLARQRTADYRAELAYNHPEFGPEAAEPALHGLAGLIYYLWPMLRTVVSAARAVAVHSAPFAEALRAEFPETPVVSLAMGVPPVAPREEDVSAIRARHSLDPEAIVLAAFGGVTPEKRLGPLFRAAAVARRYQPALRLLLVGPTYPHYDVLAEAARAEVADILTVTGRVPETELEAYLGAADIVSCLRFPSGRETSASWVRALAAGRPTLVTDLAHQSDVPTLDPRTWTVVHARPTRSDVAAVAISIDLADEDHSLTLALKRLTTDAALRQRLGADARRHWQAHHTVAAMADDYERAMSTALGHQASHSGLPRHLRPDGLDHAAELLAPLGVALPDGMR
jgi:glycosyltransferase involved in cell wall biosynthesis